MAFSGYLIQLAPYNQQAFWTTFPMQYIRYESYSVTPAQRLDLESTRTTKGVLKRTVLAHMPTKIEFELIPMNNKQLKVIMDLLTSMWSGTRGRVMRVRYYSPAADAYRTGAEETDGKFYMPDIEFPIRNVDIANNVINYNPIRLAWIEY